MAGRNKKAPRTGKKNQEDEKPIVDEDLKNVSKGISSSKGNFKSADEMKGKSEKKK